MGGDGSGSYGGDGGPGVDYSGILGTTYGDSGWFASGGGGSVRWDEYTPGSASLGGGSSGRSNASGAPTNPAKKHTGGGGGGSPWFQGMSGEVKGESGGSGIVLIAGVAYTPPPVSV